MKACYPASFSVQPDGIAVWFPDFLDCTASGDTAAEALAEAEKALAKKLTEMAGSGAPVPKPRDIGGFLSPPGRDESFRCLVCCDRSA